MSEWDQLRRLAAVAKQQYPKGTRIELNNMDDPHSPVPPGTRGTVVLVDDIGQIHMQWDNGRSLALVPNVDSFRKLTPEEEVREFEEWKEKKFGQAPSDLTPTDGPVLKM